MKQFLLQAVKFVGLSGIGWILDFGTYSILTFFLHNPELSNIISSWVGVTFVFSLATRKVFQDNGKIPLKLKYVIYLCYQCVLIFFISKVLNVVNVLITTKCAIAIIQKMSAIIAKIAVTPITMVLNFVMMKIIVEKI